MGSRGPAVGKVGEDTQGQHLGSRFLLLQAQMARQGIVETSSPWPTPGSRNLLPGGCRWEVDLEPGIAPGALAEGRSRDSRMPPSGSGAFRAEWELQRKLLEGQGLHPVLQKLRLEGGRSLL